MEKHSKIRNIVTLIFVLVLILSIVIGLSGCNKTVIDTTYNYQYAQILLPNGTVVHGKVETWYDESETGDWVQVKIDGNTYYTHLSNVVLATKDF